MQVTIEKWQDQMCQRKYEVDTAVEVVTEILCLGD